MVKKLLQNADYAEHADYLLKKYNLRSICLVCVP